MSPDQLVAAMRIACERAHQLSVICELAGLVEEGPHVQTVEAKRPGACPEISGNTHRDLDALLHPPTTTCGILEQSSHTACGTDEDPYFWNKEDPLCPVF